MLPLFGKLRRKPTAVKKPTSAEFWTEHNVTQHHSCASAAESLEYFHWRNDHYFGYVGLMPVSGQDGRVALDYGCGPGHDLVGFACYSKPPNLIGADVSIALLDESRRRIALHQLPTTVHKYRTRSHLFIISSFQ